MAQRGSYAKGIAKREEILRRALEVIAREGYNGASVRELAEAVGLSQAGLLHYFDSKEELFTEILRTRDQVDAEAYAPAGGPTSLDLDSARAGYLNVVTHNAEVPGVIELFSRLAIDAANPEHPAHHLFIERGEAVRSAFAEIVEREQAAGRMNTSMDPYVLARMLQAITDGIQLQWMLDPTVDMTGTVEAFFALLSPAPRGRE